MSKKVKILSSLKSRMVFFLSVLFLFIIAIAAFRNYVYIVGSIEKYYFFQQQNEIVSNSEKFKSFIDTKVNMVLSIGVFFSNYDTIPLDRRRNFFAHNLRSFIEENDDIYSIWCVFKPYSIDSLDAKYADITNNSTGQFVSTFYQVNERIIQKEVDISDYSKLNNYITSFQSENILIIPAIEDKFSTSLEKKYIMRIIAPIVYKRQIIGVIGIDLNYDKINEFFAKTKNNYYILNQDLQVLLSKNYNQIGTNLANFYPYIKNNQQFLRAIAFNNLYITRDNLLDPETKVIYSIYPIYFEQGNVSWNILFYTDSSSYRKTIKQQAASIFITPIIVFVLLVLIIIIINFYIAGNHGNIVINLKKVMHATQFKKQRLSRGVVEFEKIDDEIDNIRSNIEKWNEFIDLLLHDKYDTEFQLNKDLVLSKNLLKLKNKIFDENKVKDEQLAKQEIEAKLNKALGDINNIQLQYISDIEQLSYEVVKYVTDFTNGVQGGFYIIESDEKNVQFLTLTSFYSYNRRVFNKKRIEIGDGLAGTCALERKAIFTKVPPNYLEISSGFGAMPPNYIFLVPLIHSKELLGVLEFAFLATLDNFNRTFIEQSANIVASAIFTSQTTSKTFRLLKETEKISKELEEKENMMQIQIETLESIRKKSESVELDLTAILASVEKILYFAEMDYNANVLSINDMLSIRLQIQVSEAMLLTYYDLFFISNRELHREYWNTVVGGKTVEFELPIILGKFNLWIKAILSPVYNVKREVYKVIFFGIDITDLKQKEDELHKIVTEFDEKREQLDVQEKEMGMFFEEYQQMQEGLELKDNEIKRIEGEKQKIQESLDFIQKEFQKRISHNSRIEITLKSRIKALEEEIQRLGGSV